VVYLNHGSFGACPSAVLDAQAELRREMEREPVDFLVAALPSRLNAAREALAAFLGRRPEALYVVCLLGVAVRVFALEPQLALAGIIILLTGWPLFRLGHKLFANSR
jgi:selenocysteine lyase/cysteine desulfurase